MLHFETWKVALILGVVALGALFALPNAAPRAIYEATPEFLPLPDKSINLGLDLQGGSYLLLEVEADVVVRERYDALRDDVRRALRGQGSADRRISFSGPTYVDDSVFVRINDASDLEEAEGRLRDLITPVSGLGTGPNMTVSSGADQRIDVQLTDEAKTFYRTKAVTDSIEIVRRRIDALGTKEPVIQRQGAERIIVQVPGADDPQEIIDLIGSTGKLTFHMHDPTVAVEDALAGRVPPRSMVLPTEEPAEPFIVVRKREEITGDMVTSASAEPSPDTGGFQVNFSMDGRGARRFADITTENVGRRFAIVLDGMVISAPTIQTPITAGSGRITGRFGAAEATQLAALIRAGALPAPLQVLEQRSVGPDLGADSIRAGSRALVIGFCAVIVFMLLVYGRFGIYANTALIANVILIVGALSALQATLTLPGIAGIVLTIGMAVDANVLIFERIKEELRAGKSPVMAVDTGYKRAWSAIIDANVTTFIAALIMFQLGSGPIRGFAVTLAIGIITSVFTAFVLTRLMVAGYVLGSKPKEIKV
ncbi:MAG: protein translocase subunit SecD [Pseudomonadota bacterium]